MNSEDEKQSEKNDACEEKPVNEKKELVPCEAMVSAFCLSITALLLFKFFRPFEYYDFAGAETYPFDGTSFLGALMVSLFAIPVVLAAAAWNAWHHGVNAVRNRVLIYLMLMHIFIASSLLLNLLVTISIYY